MTKDEALATIKKARRVLVTFKVTPDDMDYAPISKKLARELIERNPEGIETEAVYIEKEGLMVIG